MPSYTQHSYTDVARPPCSSEGACRLVEGQQLHLEDERGTGRDHGRVAALAVGVLVGQRELGDLALAHLGDALIPAADHLAGAQLELERATAVAARVELGAVGERAHVVHGHGLAGLGEVHAVAAGADVGRIIGLGNGLGGYLFGLLGAGCGVAYPALMVSIWKPIAAGWWSLVDGCESEL